MSETLGYVLLVAERRNDPTVLESDRVYLNDRSDVFAVLAVWAAEHPRTEWRLDAWWCSSEENENKRVTGWIV